MNTQPSNQNGELKEEPTEIQQDTQSSKGEESANMLDTLVSTLPTSHNSQPIKHLQDMQDQATMIVALAVKLKTLAEWRKITLLDGRACVALCFDLDVWAISDSLQLVLKSLLKEALNAMNAEEKKVTDAEA